MSSDNYKSSWRQLKIGVGAAGFGVRFSEASDVLRPAWWREVTRSYGGAVRRVTDRNQAGRRRFPGGGVELLRRWDFDLDWGLFGDPLARAVKLKNDGVMHQPVDRGHGGHGVFEDLIPLAKNEI